MTIKPIILLLLTTSIVSCGQDFKNNFKEITIPLTGEKKYFGMKDLVFTSEPKAIPTDMIKFIDNNPQYEYIDSTFNMETGEFVNAKKEKVKYYGFYRIDIENQNYMLIYSKSDMRDEYGYNVFLNTYDSDNILKHTIRIYSSSDLHYYRNFLLKKDSLVTVDYIPVKTTQTVNNKKRNIFTTTFEITKYFINRKTLQLVLVGRNQRTGASPPSRYKNTETYIEDDPIKYLTR